MSLPEYIILDQSEASYAVANTPLYLVRKLREGREVRSLNQSLSADKILAEFKSSAIRKPETLRDLVTPYICLVALSLRNEIAPLRKSTDVRPLPEYKWLDYIRRVLIETYQPLSMRTFDIQSTLDSPVSITSSTPIKRVTIPAS